MLNFIQFLNESASTGVVDKNQVKELCKAIIEKKGDLQANVMVLADIYRDAGNDLKANAIGLYGKKITDGNLYNQVFARATENGIIYFDVNERFSKSDRPYVSTMCTMKYSDVLTKVLEFPVARRTSSGVDVRSLGSRDEIANGYFKVEVLSPCSSDVISECMDSQMSICQHTMIANKSPAIPKMVNIILHFISDATIEEWQSMSGGKFYRQLLDTELLRDKLRHTFHELRPYGRIRAINIRSFEENLEPILNPTFLSRCSDGIENSKFNQLNYYGDYESLDWLQHKEFMSSIAKLG